MDFCVSSRAGLNLHHILRKNLQKSALSAEKTRLSWPFWHAAETKISAGLSQVTGPAELIEMAQYNSGLTQSQGWFGLQ